MAVSSSGNASTFVATVLSLDAAGAADAADAASAEGALAVAAREAPPGLALRACLALLLLLLLLAPAAGALLLLPPAAGASEAADARLRLLSGGMASACAKRWMTKSGRPGGDAGAQRGKAPRSRQRGHRGGESSDDVPPAALVSRQASHTTGAAERRAQYSSCLLYTSPSPRDS